MEDKLKRYEKIDFLGEGQVVIRYLYFLKHLWKATGLKTKFVRKTEVVYLSDNTGRAFRCGIIVFFLLWMVKQVEEYWPVATGVWQRWAHSSRMSRCRATELIK